MSQPIPSTEPCPDTEAPFEIPDDALPNVDTQEDSFHRVIDIARAVPVSDVVPLRIDVRLACANARAGYRAFASHLPQACELAFSDIGAIERLADLPGAVLYAHRLVALIDPPKPQITPRLARARALRFMLLHQAHAATAAGLMPEKPVERIAAGKGPIDTAEDLVALVALYKQHEAELTGRTVVTPETLFEAGRLGAWLQEELKPTGIPHKKVTPEDLARAKDERSRLSTLLLQSYRELERVARYLGVKVPSLQSRQPLRKSSAQAVPTS